jgi:hypothetical protein
MLVEWNGMEENLIKITIFILKIQLIKDKSGLLNRVRWFHVHASSDPFFARIFKFEIVEKKILVDSKEISYQDNGFNNYFVLF